MPLCFWMVQLFEFNSCACFLDLSLESLCVSSGNSLFDGLGSRVNDLFCLFQAETCCFLNSLNNLNLVRANICKNNIKFGLFFCCSGTAVCRSGNSNCCGCATPNSSSTADTSSESSRTVRVLNSSTIFVTFSDAIFISSELNFSEKLKCDYSASFASGASAAGASSAAASVSAAASSVFPPSQASTPPLSTIA